MSALHVDIQEELLRSIKRIARTYDVPVKFVEQVVVDISADLFEEEYG